MRQHGKADLDEWISGRGAESDIIFCTRVRLARNLEDHVYSPRMSNGDRELLTETVRKALAPLAKDRGWNWIDLTERNALERQILVERHAISLELAQKEGSRGVLVDDQVRSSLMVNEEDHIRLQIFRAGLELEDAWEAADSLDDEISELLPYAFSQRFGFLTACPTNTGTGMRLSVLLHLPGLVAAKEVEKATGAIQEMDMAVRGLYGEGTRAVGDLFQVSNQRTLGCSEDSILEKISAAVSCLVSWERRVREAFREEPSFVEDRAQRALGILERAQSLSSEETMDLVSRLRLGVFLGLVEGLDPTQLNRIFLLTQPGHLQQHVGQELNPAERDAVRAKLVREILLG